MYVTYLDYLKAIYEDEKKDVNSVLENGYTPNSDIINAYQEKRFGLIIKIDENNINDQ